MDLCTKSNDKEQEISQKVPFTLIATFVCCMHLYLFRQITRRFKMLLCLAFVLGLCTSLAVRVQGFHNLLSNLGDTGRTFLQMIICYLVFSLTDNLTNNLSLKQMIKVAELNKEVEQVKLFLAE